MRKTKEQWLALIEEQQASGLSATQFCKTKGLSPKYFSLRKCELNKAREGSNETLRSSFVRLQKASPMGMTLEAGIARLTIPSGCDPLWLAQLIKAVA